ncbi:hypothetical protein ABW19_dt0200755 [Dactylella cylindrospora]|nr:hypothetical protein ABW19_dt0200755 [Dactylella cylindrospora]
MPRIYMKEEVVLFRNRIVKSRKRSFSSAIGAYLHSKWFVEGVFSIRLRARRAWQRWEGSDCPFEFAEKNFFNGVQGATTSTIKATCEDPILGHRVEPEKKKPDQTKRGKRTMQTCIPLPDHA